MICLPTYTYLLVSLDDFFSECHYHPREDQNLVHPLKLHLYIMILNVNPQGYWEGT